MPFLRIREFKKEFISKVAGLLQEHELHKTQVQAPRLLELQETQFQKKHPTHQRNAKSNFTEILQKIINPLQTV
ncbi:hypothetical protein [Flavobacterium sp.]|uniref:hypothetical protein n=1 Tax=Flavobacterium sp. TaxID=239 RepID=UPI0038FCD668